MNRLDKLMSDTLQTDAQSIRQLYTSQDLSVFYEKSMKALRLLKLIKISRVMILMLSIILIYIFCNRSKHYYKQIQNY